MSSSLPFTVQDDLQSKERYAAQQRGSVNFSSRRIRLWTFIGLIFIGSLFIVNYFGTSLGTSVVGGEEVLVSIEKNKIDEFSNPNENPIKQVEQPKVEMSLKEEITQLINQNKLIVFSKTYCPYSKNAKRILGLYDLKYPLKVVEVDLRDDDYEVKMTLNEISGRATFPNIFLNGKSIGGSDDLEDLDRSGELSLMLKENDLL